jgi:flagellar biosynthesis/type III secretory pathway protein FliH
MKEWDRVEKRKKGGKEGRREGGEEGRKEGRKEGRNRRKEKEIQPILYSKHYHCLIPKYNISTEFYKHNI